MLGYPWVGQHKPRRQITVLFIIFLKKRHGNVSLSFNGGKDCEWSVSGQKQFHDLTSYRLGTVLLHLYAGAIAHRLPECEPMKPIPAVYIPVSSPFTTLEDFIDHSATTYNLDLFSCSHSGPHVESGLPASIDLNSRDKPIGKAKGEATTMREALQLYKDHFPRITAILIGTRRTDPHCCKFYQFVVHRGIY
jgi:FAD synthetase